MNVLLRIFGWPHELLHALALWLIGRRARSITRTYTDIPDDLTTGQYVFVAGLPALVFWGAALYCLIRLLSAADLAGVVLWWLLVSVTALAGLGTIGDIQLIINRLMSARRPPE